MVCSRESTPAASNAKAGQAGAQTIRSHGGRVAAGAGWPLLAKRLPHADHSLSGGNTWSWKLESSRQQKNDGLLQVEQRQASQ